MRRRSAPPTTGDQGFRSLEVRAASFDEEKRSVEAIISTETPVSMPDWSRMEMVPEVLLSKGAEFPKSRQVPFLDSHNRYSVKDQLGSVRGITVNNDNLTATLVFSRAMHAEEAFAGVRDGHITDVSVGYDVLKRQYVPEGQTKTIGGREFSGPVNVVTKWRLREVSLTPIGADAQAKLRGLDPAAVRFLEERTFEMNEALRALLVSRGMPATHTDDEAQRWLLDNADKLSAKPEPAKAPEPVRSESGINAESLATMIEAATRKAVADQAARREAADREIRSLCELAELPDEFAACRDLADVAAVREHLKKRKAELASTIPYGASIRFGSTGAERLQTDLRSVLIERAVRSATNGDQKLMDRHLSADERKAPEQFRHATLMDMATEFVRSQGIQTLGLTREQIAIAAMFGPEKAGIRGVRSDAAYHTTGSFTNLTLDAINKSMMVGYQEAPQTWRGPMRQGDSVPDFKQINRMRLGGIPNLPVWNDQDEPNRASMADAREAYAVEARSIGIDFSYKLLVNDDMSALTRVPLALGDAAARTVNAVAWAQVTSNPTMSDGVALFSAVSGNRKRQNLSTGTSNNPSVTSVGALTDLMRQMRGENTPEGNEGPDILNLTPSYLVVPSALEVVANQLVNSAYDPSSSVNTMVYNPARTLTPVIEPLLDASSRTAWYLFAAPTRIDTIEVTFLQGQETPVVRSELDFGTLAMRYYVLQSVAAKALNHRGVQKHTNA
jgi:hypothetical protein